MRKQPKHWRRAVSILEAQGFQITPRPTSAPGDATRLAREAVESGAEVVLVAGGDGTINEALNGLMGSGVILGALPGGTANVLCRELGIGTHWERAATVLSRSVPTPVRVGLVEAAPGLRRYFLCMAGVGLDAAIVRKVDPDLKHQAGKLAYYAASFTFLTKRLIEFDACMDCCSGRYSFLLASRVRNYGGDFEIARGASLRREDFEAVAFEGSNAIRYMKYFTGVLARNLARMSGVTVCRTAQVQLTPARNVPVYVQVDGELAGELPAQIRIAESPVRLLMPPEYE